MDKFTPAYTFDDIVLVPQYNNVPSRTIPVLDSWLTKKTKIRVPIVPSNMDSVIGDDMADKLIDYGSIPIFHRFTTEEQRLLWGKKYGNKCYISCGLNDLDFTIKLLKETDIKGVCIDIAHAHSSTMKNYMEELRKNMDSNKEIIAGNICTPIAYHDLVTWGADSVKVGIGAGGACTTRMVTGFGVPQWSAIYECGKIAEKLRVPMIADGGIRNSRDVVLALSAGASTVMAGSIFSNTYESAAEKIEKNGVVYSKYRGQASADFQKEFYGKVKKNTVAEGIAFTKVCDKSVVDVLDNLTGGLRSGLTYAGSKDIKELQRKAEFRLATSTYMSESKPRPSLNKIIR
jgi:IMP dehydrogenase